MVAWIKNNNFNRKVAVCTPTVSENGSTDDGATVHNDSPAVAHGGGAAISPSTRKS
jgi:hypothetical protein